MTNRLIFDTKKRKIFFNGSCLEVLELCQAVCCRRVNVTLSNSELQSGFYKEVETYCSLTNRKCEIKEVDCADKRHRLAWKEDDSCVYLNSENKCSIYDHRPQGCRDFICKDRGRDIFEPVPFDNKRKNKNIIDKYFVESLRDDLTLILNPVQKIKTLFYIKEKKEITFINKIINECIYEKINECDLVLSKDEFHNPEMDDHSLLYLIRLFNGRNTLSDVRQKVNKKYDLNLSREDFYKIVYFLRDQSAIVFKKLT